jgi:hypothetical protein
MLVEDGERVEVLITAFLPTEKAQRVETVVLFVAVICKRSTDVIALDK